MKNRKIPPVMWLRAFEATGRHMSFMKAAEELGVTPSALSHQVRQLEDMLGHKLFHRLNRAIRLTDAGERCLPGLSDGFDRIAEAMARVGPAAPDNRLVVGSGPSFAAKWLAPRLHDFVDAHPDLDIRIAASLSIAAFDIDGIDISIRFGRGNYPGLELEKLIEEAVTPVCSPAFLEQHPLHHPTHLEHVQLLHDDSMQFLGDAPGWAQWMAAAGAPGVKTNRGLRFNHADHAIDAAMEGAGVALGRRSLAMRDMRAGRLVAPFETVLPVTGAAFWLAYAPGAREQTKIRIFRDWMLAQMAAEVLVF